MGYTYLARDLKTQTPIATLPLTSVQWGRGMNDRPGQLSAKLKMPNIVDVTDDEERRLVLILADLWKTSIDEGSTCIDVIKGGTTQASYEVLDVIYNAETQTADIKADEIIGWFSDVTAGHDRLSLVTTTSTQSFSYVNKDLLYIAADMIDYHDELGVTVETPYGDSGVLRTVEYFPIDLKPVAEVVRDLANGLPGFDYTLEVQDVPGSNICKRAFQLWSPARGLNLGMAAVFGGGQRAGTMTDFTVNHQGSIRANKSIAVGTTSSNAKRFKQASNTDFTPTRIVYEQLQDELSDAQLQSHADANLRAMKRPTVIEAQVVCDGDNMVIGGFALGDILHVTIPPFRDPWFPSGYDAERRIIAFSVTVPESEEVETISFELEDPAGNFV